MSLAVQQRLVRLPQDENAGVARRKGLKTPARGAMDAATGKEKVNKTAKELGRTLGPKNLTATDLGPNRLLKGQMSTRGKGLLQDKTNKTPHPSTRRPEAGPSKGTPPAKEALERAQLVASPLKTPVREEPPPSTNLLSPLAQKPDYKSIQTPAPDEAARRRAMQAPFTPPDFAMGQTFVHPSDEWRAKVWETLEQQEVELAAGPTAVRPEPEVDTELDEEFLKDLPGLLRRLPMHDFIKVTEPPFEEVDFEPYYSYISDEYITDEESEEEPLTPPPAARAAIKSKASLVRRDSGAAKTLTKPSNVVPALRTGMTKPARSASTSQMAPSRLPTASMQRPATAASARPTPTHSRQPSSVSSINGTTKRVPSYMAPTAASLAKKPAENGAALTAREPNPVSKPVTTAAEQKAKIKKRRIVYGPWPEWKTLRLAQQEEARVKKLSELMAVVTQDAYAGFDDLVLFEVDDQ